MEVGAINYPITVGSKSALLPPTPLFLLAPALTRLSRLPSLMDALMLVVIVVLKITSAPGKITARGTVATRFSCVSCGLVFRTDSVLVSHMAKHTVIAHIAMSSPPVLTNYIALFLNWPSPIA